MSFEKKRIDVSKIKFSAFTEGYSDDLIYFGQIRKAYLTHPIIRGSVDKIWFDSYCCRNLATTIVGNIESMIEQWYLITEEEKLKILFRNLKGGTKDIILNNTQIIEQLFRDNNIVIESRVVKKYIALKNLRNAVVHSDMSDNKIDVLNHDNIPTDVMDLSETNLLDFYKINEKMMIYINKLALRGFIINSDVLNYLSSLGTLRKTINYFKVYYDNEEYFDVNQIYEDEEAEEELSDYKYYFNKIELGNMYWNNIEEIGYELVKCNNSNYLKFFELFDIAFHCWDNLKRIKYPKCDLLDLGEIIETIKYFKEPIADKLKNDNYYEYGKYKDVATKVDNILKNKSLVSLFNDYLILYNDENYKNFFLNERINEAVKILRLWELKWVYREHIKGEKYSINICNYTNIMKFVEEYY